MVWYTRIFCTDLPREPGRLGVRAGRCGAPALLQYNDRSARQPSRQSPIARRKRGSGKSDKGCEVRSLWRHRRPGGVPRPSPAPGEVLVAVKAAAINPDEAMIRKGVLHDRWPATFPSGQGSDFAGMVVAVGTGVDTFAAGDDVLGFTDQRVSHAEFVAVPAAQLTRKPPAVSGKSPARCSSPAPRPTPRSAPSRSRPATPSRWPGRGRGRVDRGATRQAGGRHGARHRRCRQRRLAVGSRRPVNYGAGLGDRLRAATAGGRIVAFLDFFGGGTSSLR